MNTYKSKLQIEKERLMRENDELRAFLDNVREQDLANLAPLVELLGGWAERSLNDQLALLDQREREAVEQARPKPLDIWTMGKATTPSEGVLGVQDFTDDIPGFTDGTSSDDIMRSYLKSEAARIQAELNESMTSKPSAEVQATTNALKRKLANDLTLLATKETIDNLVSDDDRNGTVFE